MITKLKQNRNKAIFVLMIALLIMVSWTNGLINNPSTPDNSFTIGTALAAGTPDYTCDGVNDHVQFQEAINALPSGGGKILVLGGDYSFGATVSRAIDNITIEGIGVATSFTNDNSTPIFSAGSQSNWVIRDLKTDAGGVTIAGASNVTLQNATLGATSYGLTTFSGVVAQNITATALTSGRIPYVSTGGLLANEAGFEYDAGTNTLTAVNVTATGLSSGQIVYTGASGLLTSEAAFAYNSGTDTVTLVNLEMDGYIVNRTGGELTISSDAITVSTDSVYTIDTEGDASSDYLSTINGGTDGQVIYLNLANNDRDVLVRNLDTSGGNIHLKSRALTSSFALSTPTGGSGTYYPQGFYYAPATDANLNQGSLTQTLGTANVAYGAQAFLVASGAGSVDAGTVSITVTGTSLAVDGTRTTSDSETIVSDITAMSANEYFQTTKSWIGQVTYTLVSDGATTFSADFNYGFVSYYTLSSQNHVIEYVGIVGRAGANDADFDIIIYAHDGTGWTYNATAFEAGGTQLSSWQSIYGTEHQLAAGQPFSSRLGIQQHIDAGDGLVAAVVTTANNAVESMTFSVIYYASPVYIRLNYQCDVITLIYNSANDCWDEL